MNRFAELYRERAQRFETSAERLGARSRFLSNLRGLSFGIFVFAGLFAFFGKAPLISGPIAGVAGACFATLIVLHARVIALEDEALRWARVNRDGEARCTGAWRELPETGARFANPRHPYTEDLDVFGHGSLFQRVSVAHTRFGQDALAAYLS